MSKDDYLVVEGTVEESLPNATFRVVISDEKYPVLQGKKVLAHISGKMRVNYIRILPGDRVTVEISIYDKEKGRITFRNKTQHHNPNP